MISGKHVRLRPFEKTDLEVCKEWVNDPEIAKGILRVLPVSMYEHVQWYEKVITDKTRVTFAIDTLGDKKYIGNIGLMNIDWRNRKGMLWIYLDKKFWNKGYGKEGVYLLLEFAFKSLNLNKVYLNVGLFNETAIRMYESLGFKRDGILREDIYADGQYIDILTMSVLKKEVLKKWRKL
jgi:RimJ/RimL family protein N-acetyltransferase